MERTDVLLKLSVMFIKCQKIGKPTVSQFLNVSFCLKTWNYILEDENNLFCHFCIKNEQLIDYQNNSTAELFFFFTTGPALKTHRHKINSLVFLCICWSISWSLISLNPMFTITLISRLHLSQVVHPPLWLPGDQPLNWSWWRDILTALSLTIISSVFQPVVENPSDLINTFLKSQTFHSLIIDWSISDASWTPPWGGGPGIPA